MNDIPGRLVAVRARIAAAERAAGRAAGSVGLLAVSKTHPAESLRRCAAAGQRAFGESYVQEALPKMDQLRDLGIEWHFVGPIQSNKTRALAEHFDWVHGVDRLKIAERLGEQRPATLPPLQVCIQVNVSGEATKAGVEPAELAALAAAIARIPRLRLRGLMCIPAPADDPDEQRRPFAALRALLATVNGDGHGLDTLSMGMSDDLEAAVAEGATWVRVGTAIFGARPRAVR